MYCKTVKLWTAGNIRCKLCCVLISCSRVNPRRFLVSAQLRCPEDSADRTQHTLSWLCWKSNASVPFTLKDLRGWRPVPFRWVMTIRSGPPIRSIGRLSPGSWEKGGNMVGIILCLVFCVQENVERPTGFKWKHCIHEGNIRKTFSNCKESRKSSNHEKEPFTIIV